MRTSAVVFCVAIMGLGEARDAKAAIIYRSFTTAKPIGEALAWTGSSFFATDGADTIYEFDLDGNVLSSFASAASDGQSLERGLAFDGTSLWLFNRYQSSPPSIIYELDPSNGHVLSSFSAPTGASNLFGLAFDGSDVVGPDFSSNTILQISPTGSLSGTFATNANTLGGIGFDGSYYVSFDFDFPVAPINQAWVRIDPATGVVTGIDSRASTDLPGHVFTYIGNERWLMREGFTSTSNVMHEVSFEWETPPNGSAIVPEPASVNMFATGIVFVGFAACWWPRNRKHAAM